MAVPQQKTIIDPDLSDVLALHKLDVFANMNCVKIGEIKSFNGTKKTATIQILFKRLLPDGTAQSYPVLLDCPVFTLQGGGAYLQMPVSEGNPCIVLFADRSIDDWFQNGSEAVPSSPRMHDSSDGIALVGIDYLNDGAPSTPSDKVLMSYQDSSIEIDSAGIKAIGNGGAELDLQTAIVTIKNATTTLNTLIGLLITAIEGIQVTGNLPLTAPSVAALEVVRTEMATLLG